MINQRLTWGYHAGLPDEATIAWGARAILGPDGFVDVLHDRQSWLGKDDECTTFQARLNGGVLKAAWQRVRELFAEGVISPRERREVTLFEANDVVVKANTNASGGYLYVVAYVPPRGGA